MSQWHEDKRSGQKTGYSRGNLATDQKCVLIRGLNYTDRVCHIIQSSVIQFRLWADTQLIRKRSTM